MYRFLFSIVCFLSSVFDLLCFIALEQAPMLSQVDRFFKQAIVDKNAFTSSSALVAGIHLFKLGPDVIRRWVNEVQEAVNAGRSKMSQYHALHLLYLIKRHDRLAITKVVAALARAPPKSALAQCLLIRYVGAALRDAGSNVEALVQSSAEHRPLLEFVQQSLRNKNSAVVYEAARELCRMKGASGQLLAPAIVGAYLE
jgi:coatomer protein complex subunit gamma